MAGQAIEYTRRPSLGVTVPEDEMIDLSLLGGSFNPPSVDALTLEQMLLRWIHFLAGITWIGLLYFFNLVNVPFMKEMDPATKSKVFPALMRRALFWFRWSAAVTVLAGVWYWMTIVGADVRNAHTIARSADVTAGQAALFAIARGGMAIGSFFGLWTAA